MIVCTVGVVLLFCVHASTETLPEAVWLPDWFMLFYLPICLFTQLPH